jgi:DNA-binding beta-propeller fold protein YncE
MVSTWLLRCRRAACSILLVFSSAGVTLAAQQAAPKYTVYNAPVASVDGSEILDLAIMPNERYAVVVGSNDAPSDQKVRTVALSSANRFRTQSLDVASQIPGRVIDPVLSSVATHPTGGYAIVTVREQNAAVIRAGNDALGAAIFVRIHADGSLAFARSAALDLGRFPESVAIAPNGQFAVVANSDPDDGSGNTIRRSGSLSVIDLRAGPAAATVIRTITPTLTASGNTRHADDLAPETVTISPDSGRAFVALQENNAVAIIDMNLASLPTSVVAVALPRQNGGAGPRLFPDGLAVTPDNQYLLTANEGADQERPNSVSLFRIVSSTQLDYLADSGSAIATAVRSKGLPSAITGSEPEMVVVNQFGSTLKVFVTLEKSAALAAFNLAPSATNKLVLESLISLDRGQAAGPDSSNPEGLAIANISGTRRYIMTGNTVTNNVSLIDAVLNIPAFGPRARIPLIRR